MTNRFTLALAALVLAACAAPLKVSPPAEGLRTPREAATLDAIGRLGRNGDWLVIRGYHATDDFVSAVTHSPWSHAAVLDLDGGQVIEAEGKGIHTTALPEFVAKAYRLQLMRPDWSNEASSTHAIAAARATVGKAYDFTGLVGISMPDRYYCSELAVAVYRPDIPAGLFIPRPVAPAQLHYWARVLYDSGNP